MTVDLHVVNSGSLVGLTPCTQTAKDWVRDNVTAEPWQWLGITLYVEPRFAEHLIEALQADGLTVA
jgi:hypothetical protein